MVQRMDGILGERVVFPKEGKAYTVRPLRSVAQLAILRERSKVRGRVDDGLLMIRTVEMGVVEPRMSEADVLALMKDAPDVAAALAVRIIELTTG